MEFLRALSTRILVWNFERTFLRALSALVSSKSTHGQPISCRAPLPKLFEHTRTDLMLLATVRVACDGQ